MPSLIRMNLRHIPSPQPVNRNSQLLTHSFIFDLLNRVCIGMNAKDQSFRVW